MTLALSNFNAPSFLPTLMPRPGRDRGESRRTKAARREAKAAWRMEFEADAVAAQSECRFLQARHGLFEVLHSEFQFLFQMC